MCSCYMILLLQRFSEHVFDCALRDGVAFVIKSLQTVGIAFYSVNLNRLFWTNDNYLAFILKFIYQFQLTIIQRATMLQRFSEMRVFLIHHIVGC